MLNIIIPTYNNFDNTFSIAAKSIQLLMGIQFKVYWAQGTYIWKNRNEALETCGIVSNDEYLFIDTDILFSSSNIQTLRNSGKDAISGLYPGKHFPIENLFICGNFGTDQNSIPYDKWMPIKNYGNEPFVVDWVGGGFFYIKGYALQQVKRQWFVNRSYIDEQGKEQTIGEDIVFCKKLKDAGIKIFVHPLCVLTHGRRSVTNLKTGD